ncbi:MAG: helix-turn-helix transcriptional regulator [Chitinophagaceae bacterium]
MITGEKLRLLRLLKGFKQKNVADKLGITQQAYSKLEKRSVINGITLEKIITSMNCTREDVEAVNKLASP